METVVRGDPNDRVAGSITHRESAALDALLS